MSVSRPMMMSAVALVVAFATACAATPREYSYVTDYRVVGDRTVKYVYLPGDESLAGGAYLDQGVALEICSMEVIEEGDGTGESERRSVARETNCEETRILKTEEFR